MLAQLAELVGGRILGDSSLPITGIATIHDAQPGQITFLTNSRYVREAAATNASAVIVGAKLSDRAGGAMPATLARLVAEDPYYAVCQVIRHFHPQPYRSAGVSPLASIGQGVTMGDEVSIHPYVVIADRAVIGNRVTLYPGCYIGREAVIGDDALLYPNVTIREEVRVGCRVIIHSGTVVGSDGFGYAPYRGEHHKIPQVGTVVIEDDVELGANVSVDRATLGRTVIGRGTKVDNLVQIAHNVTIGERSIIVAQAGISGSTSIGRGVVLAGQVGVVGHVTVGDGARVGAQSGVSRDIPPGQDVSGSPAIEHRLWLTIQAILPHLPDFRKRLHRLEEELHALQRPIQKTRRSAAVRRRRSGPARTRRA